MKHLPLLFLIACGSSEIGRYVDVDVTGPLSASEFAVVRLEMANADWTDQHDIRAAGPVSLLAIAPRAGIYDITMRVWICEDANRTTCLETPSARQTAKTLEVAMTNATASHTVQYSTIDIAPLNTENFEGGTIALP